MCVVDVLMIAWFRGYKRFFTRSILESSNYLNDNCLLVRCHVSVVNSCPEAQRNYNVHVIVSNFGQHLGNLFESGKRCDVNFEVDGKKFAAHKLATSSSVFRAQPFGPLRDRNTDHIEIEDMESPIFKVSDCGLIHDFLFTSVASGIFSWGNTHVVEFTHPG